MYQQVLNVSASINTYQQVLIIDMYQQVLTCINKY